VTLVQALVACGVLYALTYVIFNDVIAATSYYGYSRMSQAVSELSASGAPTRTFLVAMLPIGTALLIAFGIGGWKSARGKRALTGLESPKVPAGDPTPWLGSYERISLYVWLLWIAVLAIMLLRAQDRTERPTPAEREPAG
jgi:hypothetical protein